jgi:hypothetical protein
MEITRNQYYLAGLVLFFLGIQFRMIETVELTPAFTRFLAERTGHPLAAVSATTQILAQSDKVGPKKTVCPDDWVGYSLLSAGIILVFHSWGMPRPSG